MYNTVYIAYGIVEYTKGKGKYRVQKVQHSTNTVSITVSTYTILKAAQQCNGYLGKARVNKGKTQYQIRRAKQKNKKKSPKQQYSL